MKETAKSGCRSCYSRHSFSRTHLANKLAAIRDAKTREEIKRALEAKSDEQQFIILMEASFHDPLHQEAFEEYKELFRKIAGEEAYRQLFKEQ